MGARQDDDVLIMKRKENIPYEILIRRNIKGNMKVMVYYTTALEKKTGKGSTGILGGSRESREKKIERERRGEESGRVGHNTKKVPRLALHLSPSDEEVLYPIASPPPPISPHRPSFHLLPSPLSFLDFVPSLARLFLFRSFPLLQSFTPSSLISLISRQKGG